MVLKMVDNQYLIHQIIRHSSFVTSSLAMKHLKLTFIAFAFLLFGCKQTHTKNINAQGKISADSTAKPAQEAEKTVENPPLEAATVEGINYAIDLFKKEDVNKIADIIRYPLQRVYPIPPVKDREDFKKRFNDIFDQALIDKIANSKIEQWYEIGWRGLAFDNGLLWMANSDGIITNLNYQSDFEKKQRERLVEKQREGVHSSLKNFEDVAYRIQTKTRLIRIDALADYKYRYASWEKNQDESSKPDLIIDNGVLDFDGSGGNFEISFTQEGQSYSVYRNSMAAEDAPDFTIKIKKDKKVISEEGGQILID